MPTALDRETSSRARLTKKQATGWTFSNEARIKRALRVNSEVRVGREHGKFNILDSASTIHGNHPGRVDKARRMRKLKRHAFDRKPKTTISKSETNQSWRRVEYSSDATSLESEREKHERTKQLELVEFQLKYYDWKYNSVSYLPAS